MYHVHRCGDPTLGFSVLSEIRYGLGLHGNNFIMMPICNIIILGKLYEYSFDVVHLCINKHNFN